jgi:PhzF family phenazine biosynthesis protein
MKIRLVVANAFSVNNSGGNPAGIVLDADGLSNIEKQKIAKEAALSETAFVSHSDVADVKLEFFTPNRQIPHCGHATIAAFTFMKQIGMIKNDESSKETIDGIRKIHYSDGLAFMEQRAPSIVAVTHVPEVISSLASGTTPDWKVTAINTGNTFILVEVPDEEILQSLHPDLPKIRDVSEQYNAIGYYVYTKNVANKAFDATARMFGPLYDIAEESGTGMAAGPLASLLFLNGDRKSHFEIEQGKFMTPPSPSQIKVDLEIENGKIQRLYAGGDAYISADKIIEI